MTVMPEIASNNAPPGPAPEPVDPPDARAPLVWRGVSYGIGGRPIIVDLTLAVPEGGLLSLVGPSGCGKTTLLTLAAGLRCPTAGRVNVTARRVASVFQDPRLLPWRRARDNAAFGLRCLGVPRRQRRDRAQALLEDLGLAPADADKFPAQLSGGMRQRVALARALAIEPDLLVLDEPFNALDPVLRRDLQDRVRGAVTGRGLTAVFVTHDLAEAARISDRIAVMARAPGRIVHLATPWSAGERRDDDTVAARVRALRAHPAVAEAFGDREPDGTSPWTA